MPPGPSATICPHCRYDLRASMEATGARCPECGKWSSCIELNQFARKWSQRHTRMLRWIEPTLFTFLVMLIWSVLGLPDDGLVPAMLLTLVAGSVIIGVWLGWKMSEDEPAFDRLMLTIGAIATLFLSNGLLVLASAGGVVWIVALF